MASRRAGALRRRGPSPFRALALVLGLGGAIVPQRAVAQRPFDLIIRGGTVVDGTGRPRFRADLGITGDRIARLDSAGIADSLGARVLDARGLMVAPGFIDSHAHVSTQIPDMALAENFLRQGITSIMASLRSQDQPWPMDAYVSRLRSAPNVGLFAGHTWIRKRVMGLANRPPSTAELAHMLSLVDSSMRQGALGLASGLEYVPANYASTEEVIALARSAARYGGIYITHMRDEGPNLLQSVRETIRIAREASLPAQINHLKASGAAQFGWSAQALALIDSARAVGLDITHDIYPYTAFSTISDILFPHGLEAVIQLQLAGGFEGIFHAMSEGDVQRFLVHPWAMIETDGDLIGYGRGYPHPRSYGAFPRVIARYVRELKLLTLESAIAKMTSMPARQFGQVERGVLAEGMFADVVVFDFDRMRDVATYTDPHHFSVGVVHLMVNGRPVIANGALTGEMPGRVLRGPARPSGRP